jgi:hypothetical protein
VLASIVWSALFGFGSLLWNIGGDATLFLLGNVCAAGVFGGLAGRNPAYCSGPRAFLYG